MGIKTLKPKNYHYGVIQRGTSLTIPVSIKNTMDLPLDLTDSEVAFTVKSTKSDFDREDSRAYIQKNFAPQEPLFGKFYIQLSSKDTDFEVGTFCFDIELIKPDTGAVFRLCTMDFELEGGPTNRSVNDGIGQLPVGNEISLIHLEQGAPIVIITSAIALSAALEARVAELEAHAESQEIQIDELTAGLENTAQVVNQYRDITDAHALTIAQLTLDMRQAQEDIIALQQRVDKL